MPTVRFTEDVLQSHRRFERYLAGQEAIAKVKAEAEKPEVSTGKLGALEVTWVTATAPFRFYYSIFLQAIGAVLYYGMAMRKEALYFYVEAKRQENYAVMVLDNYLFCPHAKILVDTINTYSFGAEEIYTHAPINLANLRDEAVAGHFHPAYVRDRHLILDGIHGQCAGIGDWFAYLYFQTKDSFVDDEQHLIAVAKQFTDGAGKEAALLQLAQIDHPPILGLQKRCVANLESPTTEKVRAAFDRLGPGIYSLSTKRHRMDIVKTSNQTYLLDPNWGLIKDSEENLSASLAKNSVLKFCRISSTI